MKTKKPVVSKISTLKNKKQKPVDSVALKLKVSPKQDLMKQISPTVEEVRERTEWKKEKRDYWSNRFRKVLAEIAIRPKVKKSNFL